MLLKTFAEARGDHLAIWDSELKERAEWLVAPCSHCRDSDTLAESNWAVQLQRLEGIDPEGADWRVYRLGHWAVGWVEGVLIRPESPAAQLAEGLAGELEDYPALDEQDWSEREWTEYNASWETGAAQDALANHLLKNGWQYYRCIDLIRNGDTETVRRWFESFIPSGDYYDNECFPRVDYVVNGLERAQLAELCRSLRKKKANSS